MSYCKEEGKDRMIFTTIEDDSKPISKTIKIFKKDDELDAELSPSGILKENGEINWNCPCMEEILSGPCGIQYRSAFQCFINSDAEPKGSECIPEMAEMWQCMDKYPELYPGHKDSPALDDEEEEKERRVLEKAVHQTSDPLDDDIAPIEPAIVSTSSTVNNTSSSVEVSTNTTPDDSGNKKWVKQGNSFIQE